MRTRVSTQDFSDHNVVTTSNVIIPDAHNKVNHESSEFYL